MSDCEWGRPCICNECCTQYRKELCPMCGFENVVEIEGTGEFRTDHKGMKFPEITMPTRNPMNLECFNCGHASNVEFYTRISTHACMLKIKRDELEQSSRSCDDCNHRIQDSVGTYEPIELFEHNGRYLCEKCLSVRIKNENPDPSTQDEKYIFDVHELKWVVSKVRVACETCGKLRWLMKENSWKKQCLSCYKKA